jgi:hypothetical protein
MLFETVYIEHPVNLLQGYIEIFFNALKDIDENIDQFDMNLCDEDFRPYINRAPKLEKYLSDFFEKFIELTSEEREYVCNAFCCCNRIQDQVENNEVCYTLADLPAKIRKTTKKLFVYMYETTLNSVGNIKDHYQNFYEEIPSKVCPFCGIEKFLHYEDYKQDYDHYLCKDIYPFAAVNMQNLIPMGRNCNTIYKKAKDVLHNEEGNRRKAFYPFQLNGISIEVRLNGSTLPTGNNKKGKWNITLDPNAEEVHTWDDVFKIRDRYRKDVYEDEYDSWLMRFINTARNSNNNNEPWTEESVKITLDKYINTLDQDGISQFQNKTFLEKSLFRFIRDDDDSKTIKAIAKMIMG